MSMSLYLMQPLQALFKYDLLYNSTLCGCQEHISAPEKVNMKRPQAIIEPATAEAVSEQVQGTAVMLGVTLAASCCYKPHCETVVRQFDTAERDSCSAERLC